MKEIVHNFNFLVGDLVQRKRKNRSGIEITKWEVNIRYNDQHGKRIRVRRWGFDTKRAGQNAVEPIQAEIVASVSKAIAEERDANVPTVETWEKVFIQRQRAAKRAKSTVEGSRLAIRHFVAFLKDNERANVKLRDIKPGDVQDFRVHRDKKGDKPSTINRDLAALQTFFEQAYQDEHVRRNPVTSVKKVTLPDRAPAHLKPDQQAALLDACKEISSDRSHKAPYLHPMIATFLFTGLRKSELFSLRWRDVDFLEGMVHLKNTEDYTTKSKKGRSVPITPEIVGILKSWRHCILEEIIRLESEPLPCWADTPDKRERAARQKAGTLEKLRRNAPAPDRHIFPSPASWTKNGGTRAIGSVDRPWKAAKKLAKIEGSVGIHALRHTFAFNYRRAGGRIDDLKDLMGHSSVSVTERNYLRFGPAELPKRENPLNGLSGALLERTPIEIVAEEDEKTTQNIDII